MKKYRLVYFDVAQTDDNDWEITSRYPQNLYVDLTGTLETDKILTELAKAGNFFAQTIKGLVEFSSNLNGILLATWISNEQPAFELVPIGDET